MANRVRLQNFTYETLDEQPTLAVRKRLTWLRRDPDGYLPHSYEQLANAYRRSGREEEARRTAITKQWHRRTVLNPANKLWNWVLYLTVGYGYRTLQAGLWLLALLAVGTLMFDHAYPAHMVATKQSAPSFNGIAYAADVLIPIINLGEQDAWQPRGAVLYWSWVRRMGAHNGGSRRVDRNPQAQLTRHRCRATSAAVSRRWSD